MGITPDSVTFADDRFDEPKWTDPWLTPEDKKAHR